MIIKYVNLPEGINTIKFIINGKTIIYINKKTPAGTGAL